MFANNNILIIGTVWPEPKSSAAGLRMMQLIEFFKDLDARITFACSASNFEYSENLRAIGIKTESIKVNDSAFDEFVKKLDPWLVLFDRFMTEEQFGWRVAEQCPGALRILDTEDLHCLRYGRQKALKEGRPFNNSDLNSEHARREIASVYRCDLSLIISRFELELLTSFFRIDGSILHYLPFMMEPITEDEKDELPDFTERNHFISIGNFLHEPNWDAVRFLKEEIWSLIRKELPKAELHIYGAYSSKKVEQLHNEKDGFLVKGRAEDVADVMASSKVLLAPIRFGAGLKGKLMDAMKFGTPSVTTDIGAEGMKQDSVWGGYVENDPKHFAEKAIKLYQNQKDWKYSQQTGYKIFNDLFNKSEIGFNLTKRLELLAEGIQDHREQNFIGSVLNQNMLKSYKYMSKWIEEKNKNL
ncbi:MAG: glycosyltransferase [Balneola sp.]